MTLKQTGMLVRLQDTIAAESELSDSQNLDGYSTIRAQIERHTVAMREVELRWEIAE